MIKCKFCGTENPDSTKFCPSCGGKLEEIPVVEAVINETTPQIKKKRPIRGGILAWSIVNTVLGLAGCCTLFPFASLILGIIAIVFTVLAHNCSDDREEKSKIKVAVILNTIATIIVFLSLIIFSVLILFGTISAYPPNTFDMDTFMQMYPSIR